MPGMIAAIVHEVLGPEEEAVPVKKVRKPRKVRAKAITADGAAIV